MERVIVTGANGFIGKNLIFDLLKKNIEVVALDIIFDNEILNKKGVLCINCKNLSIEQIENQLLGYSYDCFFHLAWIGTSGEGRGDYETQLENAKLVCKYVELANKIKCKRFIYASSINEMETYEYMQSDGIKPSLGYIYGSAKLIGHLMGEVVAYQNEVEFLPVIITNIYGVGEKSQRLVNSTIRKMLQNEHCSFTEGNQMYDFIYISDAINSIIEVAIKGKAFHRYYIGSGHPRPLKDFLTLIKDIVNPNASLGFGNIPFNGIDISYEQFNLFKVYEDTGYVNKVSFEKGIKKTKEYIEGEMLL